MGGGASQPYSCGPGQSQKGILAAAFVHFPPVVDVRDRQRGGGERQDDSEFAHSEAVVGWIGSSQPLDIALG